MKTTANDRIIHEAVSTLNKSALEHFFLSVEAINGTQSNRQDLPAPTEPVSASVRTQKKVLQRGRHPPLGPCAMVVPGGGGGPPLRPRK